MTSTKGILHEIKKTIYFVERDFRVLMSYRLAFIMMFSSIFFNLIYLVFFGSMFGDATPTVLKPYGGDYISYILVGSVGWGFMWSIAGATSTSLRNEMMLGTLESLVLTGTSITTVMISYMLFGALFGLISIALIIGVGIALLGVSALSGATLATAALFALSVVMMGGLGMVFGGLTMWVKNVGRAFPLFQNFSMIFAGVYFPLAVIPASIRWVAKVLPFYYVIEGIRLSLIPDKMPLAWHYAVVTGVFSAVMISLGLISVRVGFDRARKEGTLTFY